MARLGDVPSGLRPTPPPPRPRRPRRPENVRECQYCGCHVKRFDKIERMNHSQDNEEEPFTCRHCLRITGGGIFLGATTGPFSRVGEAGEREWALVLRPLILGAPDGRTIKLERGDILRVARAGSSPEPGGRPERQRSKEVWTIDVRLGPVTITLWPHEFSPISFTEVMALKGRGELTEHYVSQDDDIGYFSPVPDLRKMIDNVFGG